ncbi:AsmA-like C-terminal region-containing protein [Aquabacter sp. CN5-332]|uniref:YhdP family protein n=1 Tax=Aquabacter sp. CN5-332 TaxID=3156608 RepID=UPI0032B3AE4D
MKDDTAELKPTGRHVRRGRLQGIAGALVPRGRVARIAVWSLVSLVALAGITALALYGLISTGIVNANLATPYIERAIEERLGGKYDVQIGSTTVETMSHGATAVIVHDIRVLGPGDELIAAAPSAEVELEGSLLTLSPKARRIDLVGAEMTVKIAASGVVAVATGKGAKPLTSTPVPQSPADAAPAPGVTSDAAAVAAQAASRTNPLELRALAGVLNDLERGGLGGGALQDVGLKDGTVRVENESSGRSFTFQHLSIRMSRPAQGGAVLDFAVQGPSGTATLVATIGAVRQRERTIDMVLKDVATQDLVGAFSQDWRRFYMDMPLAATMRARMTIDGEVLAAKAEVQFGAGQIGNGEDVLERFVLDYMRLGLTLDPARRVIVIDPLEAAKNANKVALQGEINIPARAAEDWTYTLRQQQVVLAGPEMPDPALVIDQVNIFGRYIPADKRLTFEKGTLQSAAGGLAFSGQVDFGIALPAIRLDATGSKMPATTVRRSWPVSVAPPARDYVLQNVTGGTVDALKLNVNMPLELIGQREVPLPEDAVHLEIAGTGFQLVAMKGLPPIRDARLSVVVTGRSVRADMPEGVVITPQNRKLTMVDGTFLMPDYFPREPRAQIQVKINGPADAGIEILGMEALKGPTGTAYDPSTTRGKLSALVQINIHFRKVQDPKDTDYSVEATLTDFGVDNIFSNQRLEGSTVTVFATPAGILLRGDGRIAGAPASFEYEKKKDVADANVRVNATLDDASRAKLGINLPAVIGPVLVRLVGTTDNVITKASIELDLTGARIADLVPGLTKPPGKPLKARFTSTDAGKTVKINDLVLEGSGSVIRGSLELADSGDVIAANFPTFQLSDGDRASLSAIRSGDVLKVRISGEVVDARGIMKSLVGSSSSAPTRGPKPHNQDVDVEATVGALTGNNGEVLRQFDLSVGRRGVELRTFTLTARAGRDGTVMGDIRPVNGRNSLVLTTTDAGAVLRFLDIYPKIDGGEMSVVVDPPRGDSSPQDGTINLRDFVVRGEPGLDILAAAARDSAGRAEPGTAAFQKAQTKFTRTPGSVTLRDGAIYGPVAGATVDGTVDFAGERVALRGTYVPAYGLNNLFSKLPIIGLLLGGGPNEGLLGVTFEIVGPLSGPRLTVNPLSVVAPGFLRKMFEFRDTSVAAPPPAR